MPFVRSHSSGREPVWRAFRRAPPLALPTALRPWLLDRGSLTRRLQMLSGQRLGVRILHQGFALPRPSERRALGLVPRRRALIREVLLLGADEPWVYARSVLPVASLSGELRHWRKLDARPLGARLFDRHDLGRGALEIGLLAPGAVAAAAIGPAVSAALWGRRSVFTAAGKPLLVCEVFLPAFPPLRQAGRH